MLEEPAGLMRRKQDLEQTTAVRSEEAEAALPLNVNLTPDTTATGMPVSE